jgi:hypothetical protein
MNSFKLVQRPQLWLAALVLAAPLLAWAGPGAHGPDGEHLDGPGAQAHAPAGHAPRLEAHTDLFELVATLAGGELTLLIDRYATNEPVLGAQVEVAAGEAKAVAKFHADHGDYAVADEAFLKAISRPGEHALVITVTAGADADLLDGVLKVSEAAQPAREGGVPRAWAWAVLVLAAFVLVLGVAWRVRIGGASVSNGGAA